ncbi:MAG: tetratricopeptide repeat protein [Planctomycetota bacterium]
MRRARGKKQSSGQAHPAPQAETRRPAHSALQPGIGNRVLLLGAVALFVTVTYWPALSSRVLTFDDDQYVADNHLVQSPGWASAKQFLGEVLKPSTVGGYYQPLAMISLMVDYALGGRADYLEPFKRASLVLHVLNTLLVMVLLYLLLGRAWAAALAGALFGLHPITLEAVAWIAERKTLLAAFFALGSLIVYVRYVSKSDWKRYSACLALYVLALLSKPSATPLPVLMLLLDYWPIRRLGRRAIVEKLPFLVVAGIFAVITVISQSRALGITTPADYPWTRVPFLICHNIIFYLYQLVWPVHSSGYFFFPEPFGWSCPMVRVGVVGTCLLIPVLLISARWTRAFLIGWLFFFVAVFPTLGIIGFHPMVAADRHAYLPMIGLLLPVVWVASRAWEVAARRRRAAVWRGVVLGVGLILVVAETWTTRRALAHWRDNESYFRYLLTISPYLGGLHHGLAMALSEQGRTDEALVEYAVALHLKPDYADAITNLGGLLARQGRLDEAIAEYRKAIRLKPTLAPAFNNLGNALFRQRAYAEAVENYEQALRLKPNYADAHHNLGTALLALGKKQEAIAHYRQTLQLRPGNPDLPIKLGRLLTEQGDVAEAQKLFTAALRLKPDSFEAHSDLADLLAEQGKSEAAIKHYTAALRTKPDSPELLNNLGIELAKKGDTAQAVEHFTRALQFHPQFVMARKNLAQARALQGKLDEAIGQYREVLRTDPSDALAHYDLGRLLEQGGRLDEAIREYRAAMGIDPGHTAARQALDAALTRQNKP